MEYKVASYSGGGGRGEQSGGGKIGLGGAFKAFFRLL